MDSQFLIIVPIVIGLVEVAKRTGLADKWAPVLSLVLGVFLTGLFIGGFSSGTFLIQGIIVGLTASGLYSGVRATIIQ